MRDTAPAPILDPAGRDRLGPAERAAAGATRYIAGVAATLAALIGAYFATLVGLDRGRLLPPPAIANELCTDEKLQFLRDSPRLDPNLLTVGSSIAWRDVDSAELVRQQPRAAPLNGGFCHASANETEYNTAYLLGHFPRVRTVVGVFVPQDFQHCAKAPERSFDPAPADAYAFERRWRYAFYISQFDPVALARNTLQIAALQSGREQFDSLEMTPFGDGPLRVTEHRALTYGRIERYDPACFAALRDMARMISAGGRELLVATAPLNPGWTERFDPDQKLRNGLADGIREALTGLPRTRMWDGSEAFGGRASDFVDAIHINWPAARRFSAMLGRELGGADLASR